MKRCPLCNKTWEVEENFCPWDGYRLKQVEDPFEEIELFPDLFDDSPSVDLSSDDQTENQSLVDIAIAALERKRKQEHETLLEHMRLFEEFNIRCRAVQQFVDRLTGQSDNFTYKASYMDEHQSMWMRFTLSFGSGRYRRTFPIEITYHREPRREVRLEIDLFEIGPDNDKRYFRTEKAGGKVEKTLSGYNYLLVAPAKADGAALRKWLENSFKSIFKLAYEI
jgi:hypothetical protein